MNFEEKSQEQIANMTPEELAAYNKAKAAAEKAKKAAEKASNNSDSAGITEKHFQEQGAQSKKNRSNGGEDVKVSLTNKTMVRFTKDFGYMKEGHKQEVSDVALAIYEKAGVVEKL